MRLLLAIEPTDTSGVVARQVAARPWPDGTVARVLTVIEYAAVPSEVWKEANGDIELVRPVMQTKAEEVVARTAKELTTARLLAEYFILEGDDPRMAIVDEAKERLADFIFIRSHVFHSITRWLLGSVAKTVLRNAPCSVEVVRLASDEAVFRGRRGMKILLATDGSECSKAAASSVAARPWPENSEVKVISATDPFGFSPEDERVPVEPIGESDGPGEVYVTREERAVHEAKEILAYAGLKLTGAVVSGYPKAAIVDEAKEWGADLVVVGAHGRRGIERILLGSVSEAVAMHAPCSVEVIRSPVLWGED